MNYTIESGKGTLTVNSHGAEPSEWRVSGEEVSLLWDAKPLWARSAPFCFPYVSRLEQGYFEYEGKRYPGAQHGFSRDSEHTLVSRTADSLTFVLEQTAPDERWPWPFRLVTEHRLTGNRLTTTCTVENSGNRVMPVQMGFHTAIRVPFIPGSTYRDYDLRFEKEEAPDGSRFMPLTDTLFDHDFIGFEGLRSAFIEVVNRNTNARVRFETKGFPYVLTWSKPGEPQFVCVEPWTGQYGPGTDLFTRPGAVAVAAGECFSAAQSLVWMP